MVGRGRLRTALFVVGILLLWAAYFVICSAPTRAPFIYADF